MTVFLTGASGHLGANVVRELLARDERVRVLLREGSNNAAVEGLDIETVYGDLRHTEEIESWLDGCDRVIHIAAMISIRDRDRDAMVAANVHGTRNLLDAAQRVGVAKMVHCSSLGAVGRNPNGSADEDRFPSPTESSMFYEKTKVYAELEVLRAAAEGLDVTILNPSGMIGPHDYKPSMIGQTIIDFAHGRLPAYVRGGYDFVPVADVARAHLLALEHGRPGRRYLLSGQHATLEQILGWLSEFTGRPVPKLALPPGAILPFVGIKDWIERKVAPRRHPRFTRQSIHMLCNPKYPSSERAKSELGWTPGPLRDAFEHHLDWFRAQGRIRD